MTNVHNLNEHLIVLQENALDTEKRYLSLFTYYTCHVVSLSLCKVVEVSAGHL